MKPSPVMLREGYVPVTMVAEYLEISRAQLYRLISSGYLKGARLGKGLYISIFDLRHYYAGNTPILNCISRLRDRCLVIANETTK